MSQQFFTRNAAEYIKNIHRYPWILNRYSSFICLFDNINTMVRDNLTILCCETVLILEFIQWSADIFSFVVKYGQVVLDDAEVVYKSAIQELYQAVSSSQNCDLSVRYAIKSALVDILADYGNFLYKKSLYSQARKFYDQALRLDPEHLNVIAQIGMCFTREQDYIKARAYFEMIPKRIAIMQQTRFPLEPIFKWQRLSLIRDKSHALLNISYTYRLQYAQTKDADLAESLRINAAEYLRRALELCPQDVDILAEEQNLRRSIAIKLCTSSSATFFSTKTIDESAEDSRPLGKIKL